MAKLFISYSHKDEDWFKLLDAQLSVLRSQYDVSIWSDKSIRPGELWEKELFSELNTADAAILLISANFLHSNFISNKELPAIEKRVIETPKEFLCLPLIVEPCPWKMHPFLKGREARPKKQPVSAGNEHQQLSDLCDFVTEISKFLIQVSSGKIEPEEDPPPPILLANNGGGYATLEVRLSSREWDRYQVEMNFTWSGDRQEDFFYRYITNCDVEALSTASNAAAQAVILRKFLFPDDDTWSKLNYARVRANNIEVPLRIRLCIEPNACQLHSLNWEALTEVGEEAPPLSFSSTDFARYIVGHESRSHNSQIRRKNAKPKALLFSLSLGNHEEASDASNYGLNKIEGILSGNNISCTVIDGYQNIQGIKNLLQHHNGVDFLYLTIRGYQTKDLACQSTSNAQLDYGVCASAELQEIGQIFESMDSPPRLVVVLPELSTASSGENWSWVSHLGPSILEQGVLGVLAPQTAYQSENWEKFLKIFFAHLLHRGQMDSAVRHARQQVTPQVEIGYPVLMSRLRSAKLWYEPHFMDEAAAGGTWKILLNKIRTGKCIPIIGPGIDSRIVRFRRRVALDWAEKYNYPLAFHERINLPQVAQYIASTHGYDQLEQDLHESWSSFLQKRYSYRLDKSQENAGLEELTVALAKQVLKEKKMEPHNILATLPFPLYITANFNNFLTTALKLKKRKPKEGVFTKSDSKISGKLSQNEPLVYHLFGQLDDIPSLVLTEDDYFDFLIDFWRDRSRVPTKLLSALSSSSLIFLGFNLKDWDFRVLFRSLLRQEAKARMKRQLHIAVQVDPDDDQVTDPQRAREYLEKYFKEFQEGNVNIFWGSAEDFLVELNKRWEQ